MFRKMRHSELLESDCHYPLRNDILRSSGAQPEGVAISVAWDWQFTGITQKYSKEYNERIRQKKVSTKLEKKTILALHESTVIRCAQTIIKDYKKTNNISDINYAILHGIVTTLAAVVANEKDLYIKFQSDPDIEYYPHSNTSTTTTCMTCNCELANHYVWGRENQEQLCMNCYDEKEKFDRVGMKNDNHSYLLCYNIMNLDDELKLLENVKTVLEP
jgi:hypothetical protein